MKKNLLDQIKYPHDLRKFKKKDLKQIANELRKELIDVVSVTGGHLGAGLGVIELTIAFSSTFIINVPFFNSTEILVKKLDSYSFLIIILISDAS